MKEPVEDRGRDGGVVEDLAPAGDAAVGGEDDRAVFVAAGDDLEEMRRGLGGQGEVGELVDDQGCGAQGSEGTDSGRARNLLGRFVTSRNMRETLGGRGVRGFA